MKAKAWHCWLTAITLITIALCVRQRTLNGLRAVNDSLRQQLDSQPAKRETAATRVEQSINAIAALSPEEHSELLRLRGEFQPLRRELQEASNRVVKAAQASQPAIPSNSNRTEADRAAEFMAMNELMRSDSYRKLRAFSIAVGQYIKSHAGEVPSELEQIEPLARTILPQGFSQQFELLRTGAVSEEARDYTFVAREKAPQQSADGKWRRYYLLANGGTSMANLEQVAKPSSRDWRAWEVSNEKLMKTMATRKR